MKRVLKVSAVFIGIVFSQTLAFGQQCTAARVTNAQFSSPFGNGTVFKTGSPGSWHDENAHIDNAGTNVYSACAVDMNVGTGSDDEGMPLVAVADGTVVYADIRSGFGNTVIIQHSPNTRSQLSHLYYNPKIKPGLKVGDMVRKASVIGFLGNTGGSSSPHLHFEWQEIDSLDPVIRDDKGNTSDKWKSYHFPHMDGQMVTNGGTVSSFNGRIVPDIAVTYADGTFVKDINSTDIYYVDGGKLRKFGSLDHFRSWFPFYTNSVPIGAAVALAGASTISAYPKGSDMSFRPGVLLRSDKFAENIPNSMFYQVVYDNSLAKKKSLTFAQINAMGFEEGSALIVKDALILTLPEAPDVIIPPYCPAITALPGGKFMDESVVFTVSSCTTPPALTAMCSPASSILVAGDSKQFTLTPTGGTPPYNYSWSTASSGIFVSGSDSTTNVSFPAMGSYIITGKITDSGSVSAGTQQTTQSSCSVQVNGVVPIGPTEFSKTSLAADPSLISYWPLENTSDVKAKNPLTNNGASFEPAQFGNGANLGSNNTVRYLTSKNDPRSYAFLSGFAYNLWYKPSFAPSGGARWELGGGFSDQDKVNIRIDYLDDGGVAKLLFIYQKNGVSDTQVAYPTTLPTNLFTMLTITYDGFTVRGFVNGNEVGNVAASGSGVGLYGESGFSVGAAIHGGNKASGIIDDVTAFSRPLSASEVAQVFGGGGAPVTPITGPVELSASSLSTDPNLVAYYRFEGNSNDSRGSNHGSGNSVAYSTANGKFGQGAGFNGLSSKVDFGNPLGLQITGAISIHFWLKDNGSFTNPDVVVMKSNDSNLRSYAVYFDSGSLTANFSSDGGGSNNFIFWTTVSWDQQWHMWDIVFVPNGSNSVHKIYKDGVLQPDNISSSSFSGTAVYNSGSNLVVGQKSNGGWQMHGALDDVAVFNRALSASEVAQVFSGGGAPVTPSTGTVKVDVSGYSGTINCKLNSNDLSAPVTWNSQPAVSYTLSCTAPSGYSITSITPDPTQMLSAGATVTFMVNLAAAPTPSFTFVTLNASKTVEAGKNIGFDLSLNPVTGFFAEVSVFVAGLPANTAVVNATLKFSVGPVNGANFTLTLQTSGNTPVGTHPLTLTALGGGISKTLSLSLTVTPAPPAPLSVSCYLSPNPVNLGQGTTLFVSATGGSGSYVYSLNGGVFQSGNSSVVIPPNAGTVSYSAVAKDSSGITASANCSVNVTGVAPGISGSIWDSQPTGGVQFSGNLSGNAFTSAASVWFYGPGCSNGCQHPSAGVSVLSLTNIRLTNVQLASGNWQAEVRTVYGTAKSNIFTVR